MQRCVLFLTLFNRFTVNWINCWMISPFFTFFTWRFCKALLGDFIVYRAVLLDGSFRMWILCLVGKKTGTGFFHLKQTLIFCRCYLDESKLGKNISFLL